MLRKTNTIIKEWAELHTKNLYKNEIAGNAVHMREINNICIIFIAKL
jgi:hypothetical protein